MQIHSSRFQLDKGWAAPLPGGLDSPQTLVPALGAKAFETAPALFESLAAAFPNAVIAGCSTSGESAGACVNDQSLCVAVARFDHTRLPAGRPMPGRKPSIDGILWRFSEKRKFAAPVTFGPVNRDEICR
jgi:FIST N domain